jgi:hypothetical protein
MPIDPCVGWCWSCVLQAIGTDDVPDGSRTLALSYNDCMNPSATDDDQDRGENGRCEKWEGKRD